MLRFSQIAAKLSQIHEFDNAQKSDRNRKRIKKLLFDTPSIQFQPTELILSGDFAGFDFRF